MDSKRPVGRSEPEPIRQVVGFQVAGMEESPASLGKLARNKEQGGSDSSLQPLVTIVPTAFSGRRDSARGGGTPAESQTGAWRGAAQCGAQGEACKDAMTGSCWQLRRDSPKEARRC